MNTRLIALLLIGLVASSHAQSICDKYAGLLGVTGWTLIGVVVNGTVGSVTTNSTTKPYFDGSLNPFQTPGAVNYTDPANAGATNALVHSLDAFFYLGLNCTDNSGQPYTGQTMKAAHAALPIGPTQFDSFNKQLLSVLDANGVTPEDQAAVLAVLNSFKPDICNQPACHPSNVTTICERYSAALGITGYQLMDVVVTGVLANITSSTTPSPLIRFFNGTSNSVNYLAPQNAALLNTLRNHLDQFFGSALGCTGSFPTYQGKSLADSHKGLPIDKASFDLFNQVVLGVLAANGVSAADRAAVLSVLNGTQGDVCTLCNTATTSTSTAAATSSTTGTITGTTGTTGSVSTTSAAAFIAPTFVAALFAASLLL